MRKVISLVLAITVASSASAEGLCAIFCKLEICCSPPVEAPKEPPCCKGKKESSESKENKDCCKLMGEMADEPAATLVKDAAPQIDFPILCHEPNLSNEPASFLEKAPKIDTNEGRAPPGHEHRSDSPRAPPVARV